MKISETYLGSAYDLADRELARIEDAARRLRERWALVKDLEVEPSTDGRERLDAFTAGLADLAAGIASATPHARNTDVPAIPAAWFRNLEMQAIGLKTETARQWDLAEEARQEAARRAHQAEEAKEARRDEIRALKRELEAVA